MTKIVTIDGPAGSGKSTLARLLAEKIDYHYLETGQIYRAITAHLLAKKITPNQLDTIKTALSGLKVEHREGSVFFNGEKVEDLRSEKIEHAVIHFAKVAEIRSFCRGIQQDIASQENTVIEGRDIGTVVFPSAFCKFYIDARLDIRLKRRYEAVKKTKPEVTLEDVRKEILLRDNADRNRKRSPLLIPNDAVIVDVSDLTIEQALERILKIFQKKVLLSEGKTDSSRSNFEEAISSFEDSQGSGGETITGTVLNIDKEILLDIGEKMDAFISLKESDHLRAHDIKVGEQIEVLPVNTTERGMLVSKFRAELIQRRKDLEEKLKNKELVKGVVKTLIPEKGYKVSLQGVQAFCPIEEYDVRNFNAATQGGRRAMFEILSITPKQILVSRKKAIERIQEKNLSEFYSQVHEGDIIEVKAVSIKPHGVIVKVMDGVISILRNREISWKRQEKGAPPIIKVGDVLPVVVTKVDHEQKRIEISKKRTEEDPFDAFVQKHRINDIVECKVVHFEDFGAFLELVPGVEGLALIHDLSWKRNITHPKEVLKKGQVVEAAILRIEENTRRIRLGIKQLLENPWSSVEEKHPVDSQSDAVVLKTTAENIYCLIDEVVEGEVYYKNSYFYKRGETVDFSNLIKEGDVIRTKVLKINRKLRKLDLELKESISDPWQDLKLNYGNGEPLKGVISAIVEKGVEVKVNDTITGFCHISQLTHDETKKIEDVATVGDEYSFVVQFIDEEKKKLTLSKKDLADNKNADNDTENSGKDTITLSQFIKD